MTNQTYKLKTDSQNKKFSFSYFSNLTLYCLDAKKTKQTKKHAKHLIHAQSFKKNSKKVAWYSTVKIVNIFMPWISKIPLFWTKCYRFSSERHSLPFHVRPVQQNFGKGFPLILRMRNVQIFMYRRRRCRPRFQIVRSVIFTKTKSVFKLVSLIVSHTKV